MLRAGAYRRHIENRIRPGNAPPPSLPCVTRSRPARTTRRRIRRRRRRAAGAFVAIAAAIAAALASATLVSSSMTVSSPSPAAAPVDRSHDEQRPALGEAGGAVPAGTTVFDDALPGVGNLDAALRDALRRAAADAAQSGVHLVVDSGWRSRAYQARLFREAIAKYGSEREAARWVATPDTSAHVSGDAVDIGPSGAAAWLSEHGAEYGLCRIYGNEPWHYELRPDAVAHGCPAMYADPTHDPRMQP
jgi:zinc D-Ala-D-Ala carboxypeptidase